MAKFTMADLLNSQSKKMEERPAFEIRHIPIDKLKPSKKNQYGIRGIEELAANIEMLGLLHNLDVKEADEAGYYEIISGERRYQACKLLYESGNQEFKTLPCKVEALTENKAISELKLLYANAAARELTDYEKTYQAGRIKEILQALKKDGYKFQGRMREIVADMLEEAQRTIREICINSEYEIQDFRVFVEYPTGEGGDNGTKKHDNR